LGTLFVLFRPDSDRWSWCRTIQARIHVPMRLLAYCLLPNHWHLLLWPAVGQDLSRFVGWLT
jgi:putative transposase